MEMTREGYYKRLIARLGDWSEDGSSEGGKPYRYRLGRTGREQLAMVSKDDEQEDCITDDSSVSPISRSDLFLKIALINLAYNNRYFLVGNAANGNNTTANYTSGETKDDSSKSISKDKTTTISESSPSKEENNNNYNPTAVTTSSLNSVMTGQSTKLNPKEIELAIAKGLKKKIIEARSLLDKNLLPTTNTLDRTGAPEWIEYAVRRESDKLIPRSGRLLSSGAGSLDRASNPKDVNKYWDGVARVMTLRDELRLEVPLVVNDAWVEENIRNDNRSNFKNMFYLSSKDLMKSIEESGIDDDLKNETQNFLCPEESWPESSFIMTRKWYMAIKKDESQNSSKSTNPNSNTLYISLAGTQTAQDLVHDLKAGNS